MQIMFADETERTKTGKSTYFCVCSVTIPHDKLQDAYQGLRKVCDTHSLTSLKQTRNRGFDQIIKLQISEDVASILRNNSATVRCAIIGESGLREIEKKEDKYMFALFFLIERWFISLRAQREMGLMIFDYLGSQSEPKLSKRYFEHVTTRESRFYNKSYGTFDQHIYPSLLFADDDHCPVLQAADLIGLALSDAIKVSISTGKGIDIEELYSKNPFLKPYWPLFVKSPVGSVDRWGIRFW